MGKNKLIQHKYLFIAVKPEFAYKLISGQKDIELRKTKPNVQPGDYVIIYASAPTKAVLGFGKIKEILQRSPQEMWNTYSERLGIEEQVFLSYYENSKKSIGIEFEMIKPIRPIGLDELRRVDPDFHPPQIYRYVTNEEIRKVLMKNER